MQKFLWNFWFQIFLKMCRMTRISQAVEQRPTAYVQSSVKSDAASNELSCQLSLAAQKSSKITSTHFLVSLNHYKKWTKTMTLKNDVSFSTNSFRILNFWIFRILTKMFRILNNFFPFNWHKNMMNITKSIFGVIVILIVIVIVILVLIVIVIWILIWILILIVISIVILWFWLCCDCVVIVFVIVLWLWESFQVKIVMPKESK